MSGALSRIDGSLDTGLEFIEGWYDRTGDTGLGGGTGSIGGSSLFSLLFLNRTFAVFAFRADDGLSFDSELSTSCRRLDRSLSMTGGGNGSSFTISPDSLALARANTS
jgi:hypothetical protein